VRDEGKPEGDYRRWRRRRRALAFVIVIPMLCMLTVLPVGIVLNNNTIEIVGFECFLWAFGCGGFVRMLEGPLEEWRPFEPLPGADLPDGEAEGAIEEEAVRQRQSGRRTLE
jgi:hypothetical protein